MFFVHVNGISAAGKRKVENVRKGMVDLAGVQESCMNGVSWKVMWC